MEKKDKLLKLKKRLNIIWKLLVVAAFFVLGKFGILQLWYHEGLKEVSIEKMTDFMSVHHPRGTIMDRDGEVLASSIMRASLCCDPSIIEDRDLARRDAGKTIDMRKLAAEKFAPVLQMSEEELLKIFHKKGTRFEWVKRLLTPEEFEQIKELRDKYELNGFYFRRENKRFYPKGSLAAHVLGFMSDEDKGGSGIEFHLNSKLKGIIKDRNEIYDGHQRQRFNDEVFDEIDYKFSKVKLTLDSRMQYTLEEALEEAMKKYQATGAAGIIMEPYTGEVLAMTSRPTFDPNFYDKYDSWLWTNRCVNTVYEPGSVFKPIVGCIGMTKGVVTPDTVFYDAGHIKVADRTFYNWDGSGGGNLTFTDIIKNSVNTGMVQLGQRIGKKNMVEGAKNFGFGKETGIDLPGEADGLLYSNDMWDPDLASFSIGQGIAVTPLQELRAICAIANGGELVKPYIVKKIEDPYGKLVYTGKKEVVRRVVTPEIAQDMRMMMEKVVSEGGGKRAAIKGYRIAGKTGTAEKRAEGGGYAKGQYIASFVGFVPADKPKYAMLVLIDTPKGGNIYGSQVSAPIFRDVLEKILILKGIQPEGAKNLTNMQSGATKPVKQLTVPKPSADGSVILPDFTGAGITASMKVLEQCQLRLRPYGHGEAYEQKPKAGTKVQPQTVIEIWYK